MLTGIAAAVYSHGCVLCMRVGSVRWHWEHAAFALFGLWFVGRAQVIKLLPVCSQCLIGLHTSYCCNATVAAERLRCSAVHRSVVGVDAGGCHLHGAALRTVGFAVLRFIAASLRVGGCILR